MEVIEDLEEDVSGLCAFEDKLFITYDMVLAEYDLDTLTRVREVEVPSAVGAGVLGDCTFSGSSMYYANVSLNLIGRLDLEDGSYEPEWAPSPGERPRAVGTDAAGNIWVSSDDSPNLHALDPDSGEVVIEVPDPGLCNACEGLAGVEDGIWCTDKCFGSLLLIGPDGAIIESVYTDEDAWSGLTFVDGELWGGPMRVSDTSLWKIAWDEGEWGEPVR